ncbi:hypothetical protein NE683_18795 [Bariatricus massiliensis]|uniref:Uncharacterized protein n=1 Tax=Bariatricus massiliensis TaxID=1745713 RepID=A0ABS8DLA0_9FIRM|nr:hypothetical protein [Bariatricus massiliensis]MCB7306085.1 hypothetical protein [Bariatricus massiliensis]MCB7376546.1 hypothetical protein [Bariatricus massiliensis]MCB7389228.1 hypothetical protein [Bariatricus massiliensis]MCB7413401.1 hypothetical protein [Bariatricus massiliensis]MCQ5255271.1 hypothetical protein [Bariatricus massiliensis]
MVNNLENTCTLCEEYLAVLDIKQKQQLCQKNFCELQTDLREYKMTNVIRYFIRKVHEGLIFLGIYLSCKENDMTYMHNSIFQGNRFGTIRSNCLQGGVDQADNLTNIILALASNDIEILDKIMPYHLGFSTNGFLHAHYNMIMSLMNKDIENANRAKNQLEKFMSKKRSKLELSFSRYLVSLIERDLNKISIYLQEICVYLTRTDWVQHAIFLSVSYNKLGHSVALFAHGLYHLAYFYLTPEEFSKIEMPEHKSFIKEYEYYNHKNGFCSGKTLIDFTNENKLLSRLIDIDIIPEITLKEESNKRYLNVEEFEKKLLYNLRDAGIISFEMEGEEYVFKSFK